VIGDASTVYGGGVASKFPWDAQLDVTGMDLGTTQTEGNNVDDARVWSGNHGAFGNAALVRASSATRDYQPAWTNAWYTSGCNPDNVNAAINPLGNDIEASTASMFVGHNRMHDFAYYLGFDDAYATGNGYNGIRDFLAGRPMGGEFPAPGHNPDTDPLNYGDFGFDIVGPEVHADGEIWVAAEIDLRDLFLDRYPSSGAIWQGFAMRGFGQHQSTVNNAECRTGIRRSEVHTAEIEVFKSKATLDGTLVSGI